MSKKNILLILVACLLIFSLSSYKEKESETTIENKTAIEQAREYTEKFYKKEFEVLYDNFSSEMKNAISLSGLEDFHGQIQNQLGTELRILNEQLDTISTQYDIYNRIASFDKYDGPVLIRWVLDEEMTVYGFFIIIIPQEAESDYLDYTTKTDLRLPFDNEWVVYWGGRTIVENYHAAYSDQRFAYDFLQMDEGKTYTGNGNQNEDYYCFSKSIFSPGNGKILEMENQIEDNVPGQMNPSNPLGNYVIIDHENGEYSFMAHFKKGSIIVNIGESITKGQKIGKCGNSGNSSEAHLHYHIQKTSVFGKGEGLPAQFKNYIVNGEIMLIGEPIKGQTINNN